MSKSFLSPSGMSHHLYSVSACIHNISQANKYLLCFSMATSTELAWNLGKPYWFWLKVCRQPTGHYRHQLKTHLQLGIRYSKLFAVVDKISSSQLACFSVSCVCAWGCSQHKSLLFLNNWPSRSLPTLVTSALHIWVIVWILKHP